MGNPGLLQSMGLQTVGHNLGTEQQIRLGSKFIVLLWIPSYPSTVS